MGGEYVVDCSAHEEVCSSCHVSLGISETGDISSTHMHGSGAVPYNKMATIVLVSEGERDGRGLTAALTVSRWPMRWLKKCLGL